MKWQPIDSAPNDQVVLIYGPRGVEVGLRHLYASARLYWVSNWTPIEGYQPTHWMPLPEPPK